MKRILLLMLAVTALPSASVIFASSPNFTNLPMTARITDDNSQIMLNNPTATTSGNQKIAVYVESRMASVNINASPATVGFKAEGVTGGASDFRAFTTATIIVKLTLNGMPCSGQPVTWSIVSADNSANAAVVSSHQNKATGLSWGSYPAGLPGHELTGTNMSRTDDSGNASVQLTSLMGERTVKVQARATVGNTPHTVTQEVIFGKGPLSKFRLPSRGSVGTGDWDAAYAACNGTSHIGNHIIEWTGGAYMGGGNLPTRFELLAASAGSSYGAYRAAGWPAFSGFWTGEAHSAQFAFFVLTASGSVGHAPVVVNNRCFVCRR